MRNVMEETGGQLDSHTAEVYRTAATVKGGRRFSFGALVIVGDRRGKVGYGYGKSNEVPSAIEKAQQRAKRELTTVPMIGNTIPHDVEGRYGASRVRLIPASPGTGVVAGGTVRAVLEHAGITDCLTKCYGSTTTMNVVKAVFDGLSQLRQAELVAELRGVDLGKTETEIKVEAGKRFLPSEGSAKPAERIVIEPTKKPEAAKPAEAEASVPAGEGSGESASEETKSDDASA
ncbi:MAG: 30S ribosomal protein S5 [Phycisphaerales bacterium JB037]